MSWVEIKKRMKESGLSYEWLRGMLFKWQGVATTNEALRYAACSQSNDSLRVACTLVLERYERVINGKD